MDLLNGGSFIDDSTQVFIRLKLEAAVNPEIHCKKSPDDLGFTIYYLDHWQNRAPMGC